MTNKPVRCLLLLRLLAVLLVGLAVAPWPEPPARAAGNPLAVIVGVNSPMKDVSLGTLRRAFLGEPSEYAPGKRLIPINHPPGSPTREQFDLVVLGLKATEVGRFWVDRRIRDQPPPPKTVPSIDLALRLVMSLPGAITYVPSDLVNEKVRAVTIDGKSVDQPGYLFGP